MHTAQTIRKGAAAENSATALLRALIDYAGLFPPASLSMPQAVANYATYSCSEWSWILGRFIVPMARLGEFEEALRGAVRSDRIWRLSVLLGADPAADILRIREFNERLLGVVSGPSAVVDTVELKVGTAEEAAKLSEVIPSDLTAYLEIPTANLEQCIGVVAASGYRAKLRTGGETADKFPSAQAIVQFIRSCAKANVAFKATAGLHHPLRSTHRLTYKADSPTALMHGFLNVFLAAIFVRVGMPEDLAVELLNEQSSDSIRFDGDGICWRAHRVTEEQIATARRRLRGCFVIMFLQSRSRIYGGSICLRCYPRRNPRSRHRKLD